MTPSSTPPSVPPNKPLRTSKFRRPVASPVKLINLAFLSFRLDFNLYYESQRDEDAAFRIAEEVAATDMAASHTPAAVRSAVGRA